MAIQQPSNWWNITTNTTLTSSYNISDEINYTNSSIIINSNGKLIFNNTIINFTSESSQILGGNNQNYEISIINTTIYGNNTIIHFNDQPNVTLQSSRFENISIVWFDGCDDLNSCNININNVLINKLYTNMLFDTVQKGININYLNLTNMVTATQRCIYIKTVANVTINNSYIYNCSKEGISIYTISGINKTNINIENNIVYNTTSHCIEFSGVNMTYVKNNYVKECGAYGVDFRGCAFNSIIENNTLINAANGLVFSNGDCEAGASSNLTIKGNRVYNLTSTANGIQFTDNVNTFGYNNYCYGTMQRCLSFSTVNNSYTNNVTIDNVIGYPIYIHVNANNITIANVNMINTTKSIYLRESSNINLVNISSNQNIIFALSNLLVQNISISNANSKSFFISNGINMNITISDDFMYLNTVGSSNNITNLNINSGLFSNGTLIGGRITNNEANLTLAPGKEVYIYD